MKKEAWALIVSTALFLALLAGVFLQRNLIGVRSRYPQTLVDMATAPPEKPALPGKIDLNTADTAQLRLLPGIGEALAQRIVDYRQAHGGFRSTEELKKISGISDKLYAQIADYLTV